MIDPRKAIGRRGEDMAAEHLDLTKVGSSFLGIGPPELGELRY